MAVSKGQILTALVLYLENIMSKSWQLTRVGLVEVKFSFFSYRQCKSLFWKSEWVYFHITISTKQIRWNGNNNNNTIIIIITIVMILKVHFMGGCLNILRMKNRKHIDKIICLNTMLTSNEIYTNMCVHKKVQNVAAD